eukprot:gene19438-44564_t
MSQAPTKTPLVVGESPTASPSTAPLPFDDTVTTAALTLSASELSTDVVAEVQAQLVAAMSVLSEQGGSVAPVVIVEAAMEMTVEVVAAVELHAGEAGRTV